MVESDVFHGWPTRSGTRPNICPSAPHWSLVLTGKRSLSLFTTEPKRHSSWCSGRSIAYDDISHGSRRRFPWLERRKATFFIVRRRHLSWILEPMKATFSWFKVGGLSIVPKPGKKSSKEVSFRSLGRCLPMPPKEDSDWVANQSASDEQRPK
jgi:hypothetical protein